MFGIIFASPYPSTPAIEMAKQLAAQREVEPRQRYIDTVAALAAGRGIAAETILEVAAAVGCSLDEMNADVALYREYTTHLANINPDKIEAQQAAEAAAIEIYGQAREALRQAEEAANVARLASRAAMHQRQQAGRILSNLQSAAWVSSQALHSGRFAKFDPSLVAPASEPEVRQQTVYRYTPEQAAMG